MPGALSGRTALIAGASRGIGAGIARRFAAEGARVVLAARTLVEGESHQPGSVASTLAAIRAAGGEASGYRCDLGDPPSRAALIEALRAEVGHVDILVNNAAIAFNGVPWDAPERMQQLEMALEINLRAPLELIRALVPAMMARGEGWVLNLTTATADPIQGPPFPLIDSTQMPLAYASSKAALNRMTQALAAEWLGSGVAINALRPRAAVPTPNVLELVPAGIRARPEWREEPVEAMAEAALALVSGDPSQRTGRCVASLSLLKELGLPVRSLDGAGTIDLAARSLQE